MTTATPTLENSATLGLFQTDSFDSHSKKSATVTVSPHKGDTVPVYQPPVLSRQNVGDPLTKKSFQKYVTSLHAQ